MITKIVLVYLIIASIFIALAAAEAHYKKSKGTFGAVLVFVMMLVMWPCLLVARLVNNTLD